MKIEPENSGKKIKEKLEIITDMKIPLKLMTIRIYASEKKVMGVTIEKLNCVGSTS